MQETLHYLLMSDHLMVQKALVASVKDTGLTPGQPKILDYLLHHDGAIQKDIAMFCHIEPASLTSILNGMEKKGYIERKTAGNNRRSLHVYLTKTGKKYADRLNLEFSKVKIGFDCTIVVVSAVTCLGALHSLGSVGISTIIAAILVGTLVGVVNRAFGNQRDKLLGKTDEAAVSDDEFTSNYVITISREFGSGGREIGKILAKQLGFDYYDSELIRLVAKKSGYSPEFVEKNEQVLKNPVLHDFFAWYGERYCR